MCYCGKNQYVGEIKMIAGTNVPSGWYSCNGAILNISGYQALYNVIGNEYGGNGTTTFALPDMRGRLPICIGEGLDLTSRSFGDIGGNEITVLSESNLPTHNHNLMATSNYGDIATASGNVLATEASGSTAVYKNDNVNVTMNSNSISSVGEGTSFSNMPPFLAVNFIIAYEGNTP